MSTTAIVIVTVTVAAWLAAIVLALGLCRAAKVGDRIELSVVRDEPSRDRWAA